MKEVISFRQFIMMCSIILLLGAAMFTFIAVKHDEIAQQEKIEKEDNDYIIGYKYIENNLYVMYSDYSIEPVE